MTSLCSHICERLRVGVCPLLLGRCVGACVYALTVCGGKCLHLLCWRGSMFDTLLHVCICICTCACMCMCSDVALA